MDGAIQGIIYVVAGEDMDIVEIRAL